MDYNTFECAKKYLKHNDQIILFLKYTKYPVEGRYVDTRYDNKVDMILPDGSSYQVALKQIKTIYAKRGDTTTKWEEF